MLGPAFARRCLQSALAFSKFIQAECLLVEHKTYFTVWVCYESPANVSATAPEEELGDQALENQAIKSVFTPELNQEFIQACQIALVDLIGPIGQIVVQRAHQEYSDHTPQSFVESIVKNIPDPDKAAAFRAKVFPI